MMDVDVLDMNEEELDRLLQEELEELGSVDSHSNASETDRHLEETFEQEEEEAEEELDKAWMEWKTYRTKQEEMVEKFEEEVMEWNDLVSSDAVEQQVRLVVNELVENVEAAIRVENMTNEVERQHVLQRQAAIEAEKKKLLEEGLRKEEERRQKEQEQFQQEQRRLQEQAEMEKRAALEKLRQEESKREEENRKLLAEMKRIEEEHERIRVEKIRQEQEALERERQEHEAFLLQMKKDAESQATERLRELEAIQEQRNKALLNIQNAWKQADAAVLIQKLARAYISKNIRNQRTTAVSMVQRAMRKLSNRFQGWKLRSKRKQELEQERKQQKELERLKIEQKCIELEDRLATWLRRWEWDNQRGMEKEDRLATALREEETNRQAREARDMYLEDLAEGKRRAFENQRIQIERMLMMREDQAVINQRKKLDQERQAMTDEDEYVCEFRRNCSKELAQLVQGDMVDCTSMGFSFLMDASYPGTSFPSNVRAAHNAFSCFKHLLPSVFFRHLKRIDLEGNSLYSLSGIDQCEQLSFLCLAKNKLPGQEIHRLENLQHLEKLDLSRNPLKEFDGKWIGSAHKLRDLRLSYCQLKRSPVNLNHERLHQLSLDHNEIETIALLDQTNSLPSLHTLELHNNRISMLRQRCAHVCPNLERLRMDQNPISNITGALIEHINLKHVDAAHVEFGKKDVKFIAKYLKRLVSLNGNTEFLYTTFEDEVIQFQSCVRGALKREQIRVILERANERKVEIFDPDEDDDEFQEVDISEFLLDAGEISDEDEELFKEEELLKEQQGEQEKSFPMTEHLEFIAAQQRLKERQHHREEPYEAEEGQTTERSEQVLGEEPSIDSREERHERAGTNEWGFKSEKTEKSLVQRREKLLHAQRAKEKQAALADPMKRFEKLMKSKPKVGTVVAGLPMSVTGRDRQQYIRQKRKKKIPAWVKPALQQQQ